MRSEAKAWLQVHACVALWGFTGILGRMIRMPAVPLVFYRMLLVTLALLAMVRVRRALWAMPGRTFAALCGMGLLLALHWITLYQAIKVANASVAITCISLGPVFLALVEPKIAGRAFDMREVLLGVAVVPGVFLVVGGTPDAMRLGIVLGVISAFFVALFSAFNKRVLGGTDAFAMTCVEMGAGTLFVALSALLLPHAGSALPLPDAHDAVLLIVLSSVCTLLPFVLWLIALRQLTAFGATLVVNLEPVYTIVLAIALLHEQRELGLPFYAGVAIILGTMFAYPWVTRRWPPAAREPRA